MWKEDYKDCLEYIDKYWEKITYKPSVMQLKYNVRNLPYMIPLSEKISLSQKNAVKNKNINSHFIKIPHYYFVPNDNKFKYIFYWDTFFMSRGLLGTRREWLMKEMVENFIYLFNTYQIIPNFNAPASMGRSQPPFFTSMIMDTYLSPLNNTNSHKYYKGMSAQFYRLQKKGWLKKAIEVAKKEYEIVWIDKARAYNHSVDDYNLSRYGDRDIGYAHSSELESGWDMTSRFYNRCDHFLPVDLNSYLYKYEIDFAHAARILDNPQEEKEWLSKAQARKEEMNKYMWDDERGIFADYGYFYNRISTFRSLASFTPLWAGIATQEQAKRTMKMLDRFETPYGLTITSKGSLAHPMPDLSKIEPRYHPAIEEIFKHKQWDYPNIWSPLEYLSVIGMLRYGFIEDAKRVMTNSVKAHANVFRKYGTFFEKLNGETGESGSGALYGDQQGFGWTNAAFFRYIQILDAIDSGKNIYADPKPSQPPYHFAILH